MKIAGAKLAKWQVKLLEDAIKEAQNFISNKYKIDKSLFDLVTLKCSNTCRFAKYTPDSGNIRLDLKRTFIKLYDRKTLGSYKKLINYVGYKVSWTSQLIHELTHFIQDIEDRCFSEVETTQNEIEFLKSKNINI